MGLWLIANQRQDLVFAIKVLAKGIPTVIQGDRQLQAIVKPKTKPSGGFSCLQSCGQ
jgi:hypothetical protein